MRSKTKNMMHCVRLLISGENILRHGCPLVRCKGSTRKYLLDIRAGKFSYEQIMADVEKRMEMLVELRVKSKLPPEPDMKSINKLFMEIAR